MTPPALQENSPAGVQSSNPHFIMTAASQHDYRIIAHVYISNCIEAREHSARPVFRDMEMSLLGPLLYNVPVPNTSV